MSFRSTGKRRNRTDDDGKKRTRDGKSAAADGEHERDHRWQRTRCVADEQQEERLAAETCRKQMPFIVLIGDHSCPVGRLWLVMNPCRRLTIQNFRGSEFRLTSTVEEFPDVCGAEFAG